MIASVIIGYFISISLITTSFYRSRANNYLSLSLFLLASLTFLEWSDRNITNIILQVLGNFRFDFLFAATLFTYFLIQIKHKLLNSHWYKWIYFPFVGSVILEISIFFSDYILNLYNSNVDVLVILVKDFVSIGFNLFLVLWGRHLMKKSTAISEDKRNWLLRLNLFIICIIISWVLTRIELFIFHSEYSFYTLWALLSLFIWWVLYYGIFRLQIIVQKEEIHEYLVSKKTKHTKSKKKIKSSTTSKIIVQLYELMEEEEVYKNPILSRLDLATRLGISEGYLSQLVNQEINKSIVQFINEYRIETAKKLLHNPVFNKYTVEAIGFEAGFKSKSTFYNAFKLSLDMSPGAYRKLQKTS